MSRTKFALARWWNRTADPNLLLLKTSRYRIEKLHNFGLLTIKLKFVNSPASDCYSADFMERHKRKAGISGWQETNAILWFSDLKTPLRRSTDHVEERSQMKLYSY